MEEVKTEQLLQRIKENKELLYAMESILENKELLDEIYNSLYYEIKDGKINYEINLYKDKKTGKLYNYKEIQTMPELDVTKYTIYNIIEDIILKFNNSVLATEHRIKRVPLSSYKENNDIKTIPFHKTCQTVNLTSLMNKYPELFIFLAAHYNIDLSVLKDFKKQEYVYKKEIK